MDLTVRTVWGRNRDGATTVRIPRTADEIEAEVGVIRVSGGGIVPGDLLEESAYPGRDGL